MGYRDVTECLDDLLSSVVDDLGLEDTRIVNNNLMSCCPLHDEEDPSFGIHMDAPHKWHCYGCKEGGLSLVSLVRKVKELDYQGAVGYLKDFDSEFKPTRVHLKKKKVSPYMKERELYAYPDIACDGYKKFLAEGRDYIRSRRIRKATADRCGLKYNPEREAILIPVRDFPKPDKIFAGKLFYGLRGLVFRSVDPNTPKKHRYRNSEGPWVSFALLGAHILPPSRDILYLVEGAFDWLRMVDAGYESCLALLGSDLSDWQLKAIKRLGYRRIAFCFDKDPAGFKCLQDCLEKFSGCGALRRLDYDNFPFGDVGEPDSPTLQKHFNLVSAHEPFKKDLVMEEAKTVKTSASNA